MCYLANLGMTARDAPRPDWTAAEVGGDDMTFKGVLSPDELSRLDIMYGDLVIVPGHCGSYGKKSDRQGIVRIPGSLTSFREANKRFKGWANKNDETDRLQWWLGQLQRRGGDVIKGRDLLEGTPIERWQRYQQLYQSCVSATSQQRYRNRKRRLALEREAAAARDAAAEADVAGRQRLPRNQITGKTMSARQKARKIAA